MYWDSHGYPDSIEQHNDTIDELSVAMHTGVPPISPGGTYNIDVAPGMEGVCDTYNYPGFDAQLEPIAWNMVKEGLMQADRLCGTWTNILHAIAYGNRNLNSTEITRVIPP